MTFHPFAVFLCHFLCDLVHTSDLFLDKLLEPFSTVCRNPFAIDRFLRLRSAKPFADLKVQPVAWKYCSDDVSQMTRICRPQQMRGVCVSRWRRLECCTLLRRNTEQTGELLMKG